MIENNRKEKKGKEKKKEKKRKEKKRKEKKRKRKIVSGLSDQNVTKGDNSVSIVLPKQDVVGVSPSEGRKSRHTFYAICDDFILNIDLFCLLFA
jgi:hypothetical protein